MKSVVVFFLMIIISFINLSAQTVDLENGFVDVVGKAIIADKPEEFRGQNIANAIRAAKVVAMKNLAEYFKGFQIESSTYVEKMKLDNDEINLIVDTILVNYHSNIGKPVINKDKKSVSVTIRGYLRNSSIKDNLFKATGYGVGENEVLAEEAARMDSKREVGEKIRGTKLFSRVKSENSAISDFSIGTYIKVNLKDILFDDSSLKPHEEGYVEITSYAQLDNYNIVFPTLNTLGLLNQNFGSTEEVSTTDYHELQKVEQTSKSDNYYTGLIIDCSGLDLQPAIAPKVYDSSDREVYGSMNVSRQFAVEQGVVGYYKSLDKAKSSDRIGNNPLVVKAVKVNIADPIISDSDAENIRKIAKSLNFMRECRVAFVF
ncbi:MAG: hypothetical protein JXR48_02000 [Candidatus Delongbacteria bacterium]|nr:hypothetical protein [Candidatus Delongbacteria bacterium]MBN2833718.1 hypothetical protein [Candidatus Delongbacteria bacterium]